ncbi:MAG: hypothetical protein EOP51_28560 [Sphingobacteriales bacterium]|nr:MAG: hypothetical protein EOP51_28560 [Sphingobacteriales bacterium]
MKTLLRITGIMMLMISTVIAGCKKKDVPTTIPQVSTTGMSAVTGTTATGGGSISSDGGAAVTMSGLCYSKTNQTPTISDDTTKTTATSGDFSSMLKNLQPSATYYVRAYATNSIGTGYGEVVTFTTGNGAPTATGVSVTGTARVGDELTAAYTYSDPENNPQSGTTFQWYIATTAAGTGETAITGATTSKYQVKAADEFKFIRVSVTPKSSAGTANGAEVKSAYVGPVDVESVTFTYNGQQVTYGVLTSAKTGRKWMDRNLGAKRAATAFDDYQAYGDLFQWGRPADGHQLISWAASSGVNAGTGVNGTTSTLSNVDSPDNSLFILGGGSKRDWRTTPNESLILVNDPCPTGWHLPTSPEWDAEQIASVTDVTFNQLKLTATGYRRNSTGVLEFQRTRGFYHTSTVTTHGYADLYNFRDSGSASPPHTDTNRADGLSCRCIKN